MSLLRFLGLGSEAAGRDVEPASLSEIGRTLESLPPEAARLTAAFAYLLARVAGADLRIEEDERASIAEHLVEFGEVEASRATLLADVALAATDRFGATDDHLVARAFRDMSDHAERLRLLRCLYAVAAADATITTLEDNEIFEIATAIGVSQKDVIALRAEFKQYLGTLKALPRER